MNRWTVECPRTGSSALIKSLQLIDCDAETVSDDLRNVHSLMVHGDLIIRGDRAMITGNKQSGVS